VIILASACLGVCAPGVRAAIVLVAALLGCGVAQAQAPSISPGLPLGVTSPLGIGPSAFTLTSQLIQTADFNSNYLLRNNPPGELTAAVSTLRLDGIARTPTTRLQTTADLSYRSYFGPGTEAFTVIDSLDKIGRIRLDQTEKLTTYNVGASWSQIQAAPLQVLQTGVATISGFVNTTVVQGGLRHELTPSDTLNWQNSWTSVDFTSSGGSIPFTDLSTTGDWTHRLTPTTAVIPSVQFEDLNYQGPAKSEIMLWRLMIGIRSEPSVRLSFNAAVGALLATAQANASAVSSGTTFLPSVFQPAGTTILPTGALQPVSILSGSGQSSSASASDWLANVRVTYNFDPTTALTVVAAQIVAPDSFGNIFKTDSVGFFLQRQVNYSTSLSLFGDANQLTGVGTQRKFYDLGATYGYRLTREWDTALTYTFRQRYDQTGSANSHSIFVLARREVTIIP
jgi:hypothetical protein